MVWMKGRRKQAGSVGQERRAPPAARVEIVDARHHRLRLWTSAASGDALEINSTLIPRVHIIQPRQIRLQHLAI